MKREKARHDKGENTCCIVSNNGEREHSRIWTEKDKSQKRKQTIMTSEKEKKEKERNNPYHKSQNS
jgi:hypothetical protein